MRNRTNNHLHMDPSIDPYQANYKGSLIIHICLAMYCEHSPVTDCGKSLFIRVPFLCFVSKLGYVPSLTRGDCQGPAVVAVDMEDGVS